MGFKFRNRCAIPDAKQKTAVSDAKDTGATDLVMAIMNSGLGGPAGYGENVFSTSTLTAGNLDDGSILVDVTSIFGPSGISFFGTSYTGIYINTNGLITFDSPETAYTPVGIDGYSSPAIAPFWSDVNINDGGEIYWDLDPTAGTVTITWLDVAPYQGTGTNSFQMVLTDTGGGNFSVEFIYEDIQWTNGFTGDATVGYTDGGTNDTVLPGSGDPAALINYPTTDFGNGDPNGTWESDVIGGTIVVSDGTVSGTSGDDIIDASYDGDPENDFVDGGDGTGTNRNEDIIDAGAGNDTVFAGDENDTVFGRGGDDTIFGGTGADVLRGNGGDDVLTVAEGDDARGGQGDDTFLVVDLGEAGSSTINIVGGEGDETAGDTLDFQGLTPFGSITFTNTDDAAGGLSGFATLTDGTLLTFSEIENIIICFTTGTRIATPLGARLIEDLEPGDLVLTMDNGPQPLRWVGKRTVPAKGNLAPIRFQSGSIGNSADLLVSPQHRVLHQGSRSELLFSHSEVLIPAKHLVNGDTVTQEVGKSVTYVHIMFDEHQIVFAEDAPSESFFPGETGLDAVGAAEREELFGIFPELRSLPGTYGPLARPSLRGFEVELLTVGA